MYKILGKNDVNITNIKKEKKRNLEDPIRAP